MRIKTMVDKGCQLYTWWDNPLRKGRTKSLTSKNKSDFVFNTELMTNPSQPLQQLYAGTTKTYYTKNNIWGYPGESQENLSIGSINDLVLNNQF